MKPKTPREVIDVLKDLANGYSYAGPLFLTRDESACVSRAIAIVRLWDADITRADVRAAERKRKWRAKK